MTGPTNDRRPDTPTPARPTRQRDIQPSMRRPELCRDDLRFDDGRIGGSAANTAARDAAIVCSIALQFGADVGTIRRALCRDGSGKASGPLGAALNLCYVA